MGLARLLPRPGTRDDISKGATLGRVIAFANQKGGVAKTTTALNLGVAFAEQGMNVLLVDLDPQGNLTMSQGLNPDSIERSMFDVLVHRVPITEVIHQMEVDLAVSSIDLAGAELALSSMIGRERALEKALAPVKDDYNYVLKLENTLTMIRENLNPEVGIQGILPTMYDKRTLHSREAVEILEENFGNLVFGTKIRKTIRYAEAPVKGSSVLKYDPTGSAAEAYRELAKEVLNGATPREHA